MERIRTLSRPPERPRVRSGKPAVYRFTRDPDNNYVMLCNLNGGQCSELATGRYLNQCWPSSLTHTCRANGRWVVLFSIIRCDFFDIPSGNSWFRRCNKAFGDYNQPLCLDWMKMLLTHGNSPPYETNLDIEIWGSFHYWESELTFGNLTNFWNLANQKVSRIVSQKVSSLLGLSFEG